MKDEQITGLTVMGAMLGSRNEMDSALTSASMALTSAAANHFSAEQKEVGALQEILSADAMRVVENALTGSETTPVVGVADSGSANTLISALPENSSYSTVVLDESAPFSLTKSVVSSLDDSEPTSLPSAEEPGFTDSSLSGEAVDGEINSSLKQVDDALYGDFRDFTYDIYNGLETESKSVGREIDGGLEETGLPLVGDVLDPFLEFQYVDTLSAGPAQITNSVRSLIGELNAFRSETMSDLY